MEITEMFMDKDMLFSGSGGSLLNITSIIIPEFLMIILIIILKQIKFITRDTITALINRNNINGMFLIHTKHFKMEVTSMEIPQSAWKYLDSYSTAVVIPQAARKFIKNLNVTPHIIGVNVHHVIYHCALTLKFLIENLTECLSDPLNIRERLYTNLGYVILTLLFGTKKKAAGINPLDLAKLPWISYNAVLTTPPLVNWEWAPFINPNSRFFLESNFLQNGPQTKSYVLRGIN